MTALNWLIALGVVLIVSLLFSFVNQFISDNEDSWKVSFPTLFIGFGISTALALVGVFYWEM